MTTQSVRDKKNEADLPHCGPRPGEDKVADHQQDHEEHLKTAGVRYHHQQPPLGDHMITLLDDDLKHDQLVPLRQCEKQLPQEHAHLTNQEPLQLPPEVSKIPLILHINEKQLQKSLPVHSKQIPLTNHTPRSQKHSQSQFFYSTGEGTPPRANTPSVDDSELDDEQMPLSSVLHKQHKGRFVQKRIRDSSDEEKEDSQEQNRSQQQGKQPTKEQDRHQVKYRKQQPIEPQTDDSDIDEDEEERSLFITQHKYLQEPQDTELYQPATKQPRTPPRQQVKQPPAPPKKEPPAKTTRGRGAARATGRGATTTRVKTAAGTKRPSTRGRGRG